MKEDGVFITLYFFGINLFFKPLYWGMINMQKAVHN